MATSNTTDAGTAPPPPMSTSTFTASMLALLAVMIGSGLTVGTIVFRHVETRKLSKAYRLRSR